MVASLGVMVSKLGKQAISSEFDSHWVLNISALMQTKPSLVNDNYKKNH